MYRRASRVDLNNLDCQLPGPDVIFDKVNEVIDAASEDPSVDKEVALKLSQLLLDLADIKNQRMHEVRQSIAMLRVITDYHRDFPGLDSYIKNITAPLQIPPSNDLDNAMASLALC